MYKIKNQIICFVLVFAFSLYAETNQIPAVYKKKIDLLKNHRITSNDIVMLKSELSKAEVIVNHSSGGLNKKVHISGSSRFELRGVYLKQYQLTNSISPLSAGIDPGATGEPNLMMHFMAMPYYNVALTAEVGFYTKFDSTQQVKYEIANNFFMESAVATGLGKYKLSFGGTWWTLYNSKLTFSGNMSGGRTAYFTRFPWSPPDAPLSEYNYASSYFPWFLPSTAVQRAGSVGVKGIQIAGMGLPAGFTFSVFGGYNDQSYGTFSKFIFWKIHKNLGSHSLALNGSSHFENTAFSSSLSEKNSVFSVEDSAKLLGLQLYSEISLMHEEISSVRTNVLSYAGYIDIRKNVAEKFPVKLVLYYVPVNYYTPDTGVVSTKPYYPTQTIVYYNILEENSSFFQNRTGGRLNFGIQMNGIAASAGYSLSKTLTKTTNIINFPHHLLHTEFYYNYNKDSSYYDAGILHASEQDGGYSVDYEGAYETVTMSDHTLSDKYFNNINIDIKVKFGDIADILKYTYLFGNGGIKNISSEIGSPFSLDIFANSFYNIFLAQGITQNIFFLAFYGSEDFKGARLTKDISESDVSCGAGFTFNLYKNTVLYLKARYFSHKDLIANRHNNFSGYWSNIEIKTLF